ncbi:unnamed protein product [Danaus chrysippus]|uniref:(African queen) hypothetical protein n=1 Tax=Danaus chrysippus TaxID=151541 RepID=A0A8J2R6X5_9NEOP|nr:unnamed protein product [Danaus chrysippus]
MYVFIPDSCSECNLPAQSILQVDNIYTATVHDMTCMAEVFLIDTGETRRVQASTLQPLLPQFANTPPYARCCHLAGPVSDELDNYEYVIEGILKKYIGKTCKIKVDDNTMESLGVYVIKSDTSSDHEILNDLILKESQALIGRVSKVDELDESNFDVTNCPEYEDPLETVTGYHNRVEIDICKHYKGGADKTCFKDGWTLDQVPVVAKCRPLPLPAPDTWLTVKVTHVAHFEFFYVHIVD